MKKNIKRIFFIEKKLKIILDYMIPGDEYMPCFNKAVSTSKIIKKISKRKDYNKIKESINKTKNLKYFTDILGDTILEAYFTSNLVIKALDLRKKKYLKNIKKEDMYKILSQAKYKKI